MDSLLITPELLAALDQPVPRYTSYPTAPQFSAIEEKDFLRHLALFDQTQKPLSLYIHIPFCKSMCLFCGCSVVLNRNPDRQTAYLEHLLQEISLVSSRFSEKKRIAQLHLGGGTPTSLTEEEFDRLMQALRLAFVFDEHAEISIEADPRTVHADGGKKLTHLRKIGFNRVSFGVQDLNLDVQEAVRRRQTEEMTVAAYNIARVLQFDGINIDLIYGLPLQTRDLFAYTAEKIADLAPDRIAFYSYAQVPWLKEHQKAIRSSDLPSTEEKFRIYVEGRDRFIKRGYIPIGMDHFSLPSDPIAKSYQNKTLTRNFQGYSIQLAEDMLGLGITSVGLIENAFFQNVKDLTDYAACLSQKKLPVLRGFLLQKEDQLRRFVIQSLMCHFELDKKDFFRHFGIEFDRHFASLQPKLDRLSAQGLLEQTQEKLLPTPLGGLFIRVIASCFDAYLQAGRFSKAV